MKGAKKILSMLEEAGYEAYIVGGAVRDICRKEEPHDIDVVTDAEPDVVISLAKEKDIPCTDVVGKSFGIVVLQVEGIPYEVATFRSERYGEDSHRPEEVKFTKSLKEDLRRRDFTINGMAMDKYGTIYDFFGGQKDLKKGYIRTIGDPKERFKEDGLRMFRACRFASQLDFLVTKDTMEGIKHSLSRADGLSQERILREIEGILLSKFPARGLDVLVQSGLAGRTCRIVEAGKIRQEDILPELSHLVNLPQMKEFHAFDAWYHTLAVVQATPSDLIVRWAALFHDVAKGLPGVRAITGDRITDHGHDRLGASMAYRILTRFRYRDKIARRVSWLVKNHMRFHYFAQNEEADAYKWMRKEATGGEFRETAELVEACGQLCALCVADVAGTGRENSSARGTAAFGEYLQDIAGKMPVHSKDLHYDGQLIALCGNQVKEHMSYLLKRVQDGQVENEEKALYDALKRRIERHA